LSQRRRPVALIVLDGWGLNPNPAANAVAIARTPNYDRYAARFPLTTLTASGEAVGLMPGQMGDSNVGHLNLGAGRIVYQTLPRIHASIRDGSFFANGTLKAAMERAKGSALHLIGLVSDGGVHSHIDHLLALLEMAAGTGVTEVFLHAVLDGRDVPPTSSLRYLAQVERRCSQLGNARIATVSGRYYTMDRDRRWERTEKAFRAIAMGDGPRAEGPAAAVAGSHRAGVTDEFVLPVVIDPRPISPDDTVIFFNFRPDRARQLTRALTETVFDGFPRPGFQPVHLTTMTQYDQTFDAIPVVFAPEFVAVPMGQVVSEAGLRQLRIAETEKYPHVTYFFNGGEERVFPGEERVLIPSPKVATYDLQPEMSAFEVADQAVRWIAEDRVDFMVLNFANPDMVGHTGVLAAAVRAVEAVDQCLGRVVDAILDRGGAALILADHGNCDQMIDYETGEPHTNHTLHPVPCILADPVRQHLRLREGGLLADAAPTLLEVLGLPKPAAMTRDSLIRREV
jgi:2,3-bisphosphoglycerate-independent phosphoglycerate mutase